MPRLPDGDPAPESGELPSAALATLRGSRLGIYVHVPFCAVRCGYCDFNTYTLTELGPGASTADFAASALAELDVAVRVLGEDAGPVDTVFVGGGTPTLLPAGDLVRCLDGIRAAVRAGGRCGGDDRGQPRLRDGSGPRGARRRRLHPGVDRHAVGRAARARDPRAHPRSLSGRDARWPGRGRPGLATSLDLIYGTPGETLGRLAGEPGGGRRARRRTTCRPTRWSSRRGPGWPPRCDAASCRCPTATTRPTSTSSPTRCSRTWPATTGTR